MKLLVITENKNDSTSFYRAHGILKNLRKQMGSLEITSMDKNDFSLSWADIGLFDCVFIQRPYNNMGVKLATYIRNMNIPLWVDYDDNLLEVPAENRSHAVYSSPEVKQNIINILKMANVVSVSTLALKKAFARYNANIEVVPNAINTEFFPHRKLPKKQNNLIMWRGSDTHVADIMSYQEQIASNIIQSKNLIWFWFGFNPWFITNIFKNKTKHAPPVDPVMYFTSLPNIAPYATHVPLCDNNFNHCKSNIAMLESLYAGAVPLVPFWEEWADVPGVLYYSNPKEYGEGLEALQKKAIDAKAQNAKAWEYVQDVYNLDTINKKRVEILKNLV